MNTTQRRIGRLEALAESPGGICRHAAVVRVYGEHDEPLALETVEVCGACGLPPAARINLIALPAKMTPEAWQARYTSGKPN